VPRLVADFLGEEERFLRSLTIFATFGKGWMNRLNNLREFSATLPLSVPVASMQNGGIVVPDSTKPAPGLAAVIAQVEQLIRMLSGVAAPTPAGPARPPGAPDALSSANIGERLAAIIAVIRQLEGLGGIAGGASGVVLPPIGKDARPLTPVNAALGQGIGKMLDGKKSAIGIIGSLVTALAGAAVPKGEGVTGILSLIPVAVPYLQPIMLALTAWGVLGKFDKWIKLPPAKS
jgi:peptidoglycan L-alanyl-D-glutamate endopeptidase CwlK